MATCINCSARIPDGRRYCTAHYMEAIAKYEQDMVNYQAALATYHTDLARWNELTPEERRRLDIQAEDSSVTGYATLVALAIGGLLWFYLDRTRGLELWQGIALMIGVVAICVVPVPIRKLVGRLARATLKAILYFLGLLLIGWVASFFFPFLQENADQLIVWLAILCVLGSAFLELGGGHHASAAPTPPSQPTRPSA